MGQLRQRMGSEHSPVPRRLVKTPSRVMLSARERAACLGGAALLLCTSLVLCLFCVVHARLVFATGHGQESASRPRGADVTKLLHTAQDALSRNDYAAAADTLRQVVEAQPTLTAAWFNLAYAYTGLHKNDEAVAAYKKTLELDPNLFEARLNLGTLLMQLNKPQDALEHLEKAASLKPDHPRAQLYYGRALVLTGQHERAEKQYQTALRLEPKMAIAHYDLGQLYLQQKRYQEALSSFQRSNELDSSLSQAQLGMALAMEGMKDPASAVAHFEQYLAARPDDLETRFHLARSYLELGKNAEAYDGLQAVYRAEPETPGLAAALGDVCAVLKKFPESEKYYHQALLATRLTLTYIGPLAKPCSMKRGYRRLKPSSVLL